MRSLTRVSVVACVARNLRPCPSYSRHRDRINLGLWRSLYKGGGGTNPQRAQGVSGSAEGLVHQWGSASSPRPRLETRGQRKQVALVSSGTGIPLSPTKTILAPPPPTHTLSPTLTNRQSHKSPGLVPPPPPHPQDLWGVGFGPHSFAGFLVHLPVQHLRCCGFSSPVVFLGVAATVLGGRRQRCRNGVFHQG